MITAPLLARRRRSLRSPHSHETHCCAPSTISGTSSPTDHWYRHCFPYHMPVSLTPHFLPLSPLTLVLLCLLGILSLSPHLYPSLPLPEEACNLLPRSAEHRSQESRSQERPISGPQEHRSQEHPFPALRSIALRSAALRSVPLPALRSIPIRSAFPALRSAFPALRSIALSLTLSLGLPLQT